MDWRKQYADLLGRTKDAVIERHGEPNEVDEDGFLHYDSSDKTSKRELSFWLHPKSSRIEVVKVDADPWNDSLDVRDVIKNASRFTFGTGTFRDSTRQFFTATTLDERATLEFLILPQAKTPDDQVKFSSVIFENGKP